MSKNGQTESDEQAGARTRMSVLLDLELLEANPRNPKSRLKPDDALVSSFRELGQLQPIVVRRLPDSGRFLILAGHRRAAAARALQWKQVEAVVFSGDEKQAGLVLLAENGVRKDFAPLEEAALVAALRETATQEQVAAALGRSVKWVARRENLTKLSPLALKCMGAGGPLASWPPSWLEELALLVASAQDEFLRDAFDFEDAAQLERVMRSGSCLAFDVTEFQQLEDVQHRIRLRLRPLRLAPWKLDDAKLVKSAGSCTDCDKTSCSVRALFGDEPGGSDKIEEALCRDGRCWNGKAEAHLKQRAEELKKEHGPALAFVVDNKNGPASAPSDGAFDDVQLDGVKPLQPYQWSAGTKKHGRPALVVAGPRTGQLVYVATEKKNGQAAHAKGPATMADKRGALEKRRAYAVLERLEAAVQQCAWASVKGLKQFASADDAEVLLQVMGRAGANDLLLDFGFAGEPDKFQATPKLVAATWKAVADAIAQALHVRGQYRGMADPLEDLKWLAEFVDFDVLDAVHLAEKDIPEPKAWASEKPARKVVKAGAKCGAAK